MGRGISAKCNEGRVSRRLGALLERAAGSVHGSLGQGENHLGRGLCVQKAEGQFRKLRGL